MSLPFPDFHHDLPAVAISQLLAHFFARCVRVIQKGVPEKQKVLSSNVLKWYPRDAYGFYKIQQNLWLEFK